MKFTPIIFTHNIPKLLDGTKTQTRRVIKRSDGAVPLDYRDGMFWFEDGDTHEMSCPYGGVGDGLWVKEKWCRTMDTPKGTWFYAAGPGPAKPKDISWQSPMFMFRMGCRIHLVILELRVQQVQEISEEDAIAEGIDRDTNARESYQSLWDTINAQREGGRFSWSRNPLVWAITHRLVEPKH